tara:strand:- start:5243 stop:5722 length:480 start_codon:yes stop_codon:yes gene_type:complete
MLVMFLCLSTSTTTASVHAGHKLLTDHHIYVIKGHFYVIYDSLKEKDRHLVAKTASMIEELHKDKNKHDLLDMQEQVEARLVLGAIQHIRAALKGKYPDLYPPNILDIWEGIGKDVRVEKQDSKWKLIYEDSTEKKEKKKGHKEEPKKERSIDDSWIKR